jgi:hypothetical protein
MLDLGAGWHVVLDGADPRWGGPERVLGNTLDGAIVSSLPPYWFAVLER